MWREESCPTLGEKFRDTLPLTDRLPPPFPLLSIVYLLQRAHCPSILSVLPFAQYAPFARFTRADRRCQASKAVLMAQSVAEDDDDDAPRRAKQDIRRYEAGNNDMEDESVVR